MPRPRNPRFIRCLPRITLYKPQGVPLRDLVWQDLPLEGLEAMRLVDAEGLSQAQAAEQMGVSTPTLCRVLATARNAVAMALSQGWAINIQGGDYQVAPDPEQRGGRHGRHCGQGKRCGKGMRGHGRGRGGNKGKGPGKGRGFNDN